jgi:hypothetical protein
LSRLQDPAFFSIRKVAKKTSKSLVTKDAPDDCGTGAGGFKEDNTCASGDGGSGRFRSLVDEIATERGFTFNPRLSKLVKSGYAVSPFKDRELTIDMKSITEDANWKETIRAKLKEYSASNSGLLRRDKAHLGAWWDGETNNLFLDVSLVVGSLEEAKQIAIDNNQLAIYHLDTGETINVSR